MSDIFLSRVIKTYNPGLFKKKVRAVDDLTLQIRQGEVFGVIGPNGAGKSTTIRMLLGLIRPDAGEILFRDQPVAQANIHQAIGYLPENPYLYDHLTLIELLTFCGRTSGLDSDQIAQRSAELIARLDLQDAQKRPLRTFSKGMLQRAGICFALLHNPSIVILDEPMSGLDPVGRRMVFDLVMELKKQGKTIFFCSHILNDVERLCDRIGLMHKGRLIKEFAREDFLQNMGQTVFLQLPELSAEQQEQIEKRGGRIRTDGDGHLVAIADTQYFAVNHYLEESGITVQGGRAEWMSLEDLFMRTVEEQDS